MSLSDKNSLSILKSLPDRKAKAAFFAGGRVTVSGITQVEEKKLVRRYVGKVRGVIVCGQDGKFIYDTQEEATAAARWYLEDCKSEAAT